MFIDIIDFMGSCVMTSGRSKHNRGGHSSKDFIGLDSVSDDGLIDLGVGEEIRELNRMVMQKSLDVSIDRIQILEMRLQASGEKVNKEFYHNLEVGEILESVGILGRQGFYSHDTREYMETFPGISPGDILMYLGWVEAPGEEISLFGEDGMERKRIRATGPKWLFGRRVYIVPIPCGLLEPSVIEVPDIILDIVLCAPKRIKGKDANKIYNKMDRNKRKAKCKQSGK